jgi:hypothetical protein
LNFAESGASGQWQSFGRQQSGGGMNNFTVHGIFVIPKANRRTCLKGRTMSG